MPYTLYLYTLYITLILFPPLPNICVKLYFLKVGMGTEARKGKDKF
jgi:hypothetical protein